MTMRQTPIIREWFQSATAFLLLAILLASGASGGEPTWWSARVLGTAGEDSVASTDNPSLKFSMGQPFGVTVGPHGKIYVTEISHHRVIRMDPATGKVEVVAGNGKPGYTGDGGPATSASLNEPYEVRFDIDGNLYLVEMANHIVRRVRQADGKIETVAGTGTAGFSGDDGPAKKCQLNRPHSIEIGGDQLYIADIGNHRIRQVDLKSGTITTLAGNGDRRLPKDGGNVHGEPVAGPRALAYRNGELWVALREGHSIWKISLADKQWHHVAGTGKPGYQGDGGPARLAQLKGPKGIALEHDQSVWIADTENQVVRRVDLEKGTIETIAGGGSGIQELRGLGANARYERPHGIAVDPAGRVYLADTLRERLQLVVPKLRVGIIGLDTSHVIAFSGILNRPDAPALLQGMPVVAAYPPGSPDIESSVSRQAGYVKTLRETWNMKMVDSIDDLLKEVDVVLLESNDGRPHLEQAIPVLKQRKRMFIDKPIAGSLTDAVAIFSAAARCETPVFSSSSLRFAQSSQSVRHGQIGKVWMAGTYAPCPTEPTHPDLYWYGIHGVESLFTVMGTGCQSVQRTHTQAVDLVSGRWSNGRIGTFSGLRPPVRRGYGGTAFGEKGTMAVGNHDGYQPMLAAIADFFRTGMVPVSPRETLEIYAFMTAADVSKQRDGARVSIDEVIEQAQAEAAIRLQKWFAPSKH